MIVVLMVLAGCCLLVAGAAIAAGLWPALMTAGVLMLGGAWLTNRALDRPEA